jgi:hypothetical protein
MAEAYVRDETELSISQVLSDLCAGGEGSVTVREIVEAFGSRAFGALLFIFSAPNLLPLPPGSSTVLGAPLVLLAPQVAIGVSAPWLPRKMGERRIKRSRLKSAFERLAPWLRRIEKASKPRLGFLFGPVGDRVIGLVCTALALVLILPIPFGNMLPAAAVSILSLSLALRDGVLALAGYALAGISATVLALAAGAVAEGVRRLAEMVGL